MYDIPRFLMNPQDVSVLIGNAYDLYADAIFRHLYLRLGNRERAKELMQDTFIRAMQYMKRGTPIENIRAFLYKIANNVMIDDIRKKKSLSLDELAESGFEPEGSSEKEIHTMLEGTRVAAVLQLLRKEDRDLVIMRFVDGMKPQEIGEILGIESNTISVRIHRALKELKSHLRAE